MNAKLKTVHKVLTTSVYIGLVAMTAGTVLPGPNAAQNSAAENSAADQFMARLSQLCGQSYQGRVAVNTPQLDDDPFVGQTLVMHVRECSDNEIRIPFHVGEDRSRTWILTRTDDGLRLKHDHRHADGSEDAITMYGGDTRADGTATRQEFPVDDYSIDMFTRDNMMVSLTNIWAMEIEPGERFVYELARSDSDRLFRVEFDLTGTVATPPDPWGHPPLL